MNVINRRPFSNMRKGTVGRLWILWILILSLSGCRESDVDPVYTIETPVSSEKVYDEVHPYYFYNHDGKKEYLSLNAKYAFFSVTQQILPEDMIQRRMKATNFLSDMADIRQYKNRPASQRFYTELQFEEVLTDEQYLRLLTDLKRQNKDAIVAPYFKYGKNEKIGLSNFFYVTLKEERDSVILGEMARKNGAVIIEQDPFMPRCFILSVTESSELNAMEYSNILHESGLFQSAGPDLMVGDVSASCANDQYFSDQWGLSNTGQSSGTRGIDINVCEAWKISTGSNVTVAVIDDGIYVTHPDLSVNIHPTLKFDCDTKSTTQQIVYGNHGTQVAGVLGAIKDNAGIAGVAPNCTIIPISCGTPMYSSNPSTFTLAASNYAWGINQAHLNGADVINCSWGHNVLSAGGHIKTAINNAVLNGRNGKGCIVIAASGNDGGSSVIFPANLNDVIAVGAVNSNGQRRNASQYGDNLDVVAPGVDISTTHMSSQYITASGTSYATPHVSGIAALLLSINPNLTQAQVRKAIESNCRKLSGYSFSNNISHPNGTWNNEVGYGFVNAYEAIKSLFPNSDTYVLHGISCDPVTVTIPLTTPIYPTPPTSIGWSVTSDLVIEGGQGTNAITVRRNPENAPTGGTMIWAVLYYDGFSITRSKDATIEEFALNSIQVDEVGYQQFNLFANPQNSLYEYEWRVYPPNGASLQNSGGLGTYQNYISVYNSGTYDVECRIITPCGPTQWTGTVVDVY